MQVYDYGFIAGLFMGIKLLDKVLDKLPVFKGGKLSEHERHMLEKTYEVSMRNQTACEGHEKMLDLLGKITTNQERIAWILESVEKRIC